ncbi:hypothetical protein [Sphingopyxis sp. GW247-27LB]|uniref:hypothetical protein n=1 Tax=Sphingopyxis sp. GW247-27LB TaxID=2012632 RepID=UPI000BA5435C|nr:hypothetical protein [Sphingopyxis sp. GW247-27LB]PAL20204.1 hypothetical protein CD928_17500 [Sphingopyxis sp. GW247-27LB]
MSWAAAWTLLRRFWWIVPIGGLLAWALILRAELRGAEADLLAEQTAHGATVANYRAATATARILDAQNKQLTEQVQAAETRRISDAFDARIADARARAAAVSVRAEAAAADPGSRRGAAVPGLPDPARGVDGAACEAGFPSRDALGTGDALIATEQAIQLDELINWVAAQQRIWAATQQSPQQKEPNGDE